ncbi:MAG: DUF5590 domain-containing protein [Apilactobacillus sp.]|uniref:cell wall elongation regulator TseB-like domain-containing protein n=1 Tax=Apilactobacillus TaxID=2767877 RepID=UPI0025F59E47|nr:DUF5590 domain-containing protein [Apilactobacillus sp.]MCT6822321.1 DUF5590 domain-containing protein [Apilactobacillus sp.]MCT6857663.1 DUF5590 domain-containing protein [Apilactobacillus sp.]
MNYSLSKKFNYFRLFKWLIIIVIVLFIMMIGLLLWARLPISTAKSQATNLAEKKAGITKVERFYMSDLNRTYYTIQGTNKEKQNVMAIIEKKTGNINIVKTSDGISSDKAKNITNEKQAISKLISVAPTIFNGEAAWAVSYFNSKNGLAYSVVDFKTGKILRFIDNV